MCRNVASLSLTAERRKQIRSAILSITAIKVGRANGVDWISGTSRRSLIVAYSPCVQGCQK